MMLFSRFRFDATRFAGKSKWHYSKKNVSTKLKGKSKKPSLSTQNPNTATKPDLEDIAADYTIFNSLDIEDEHVFRISEEIHKALEGSFCYIIAQQV